MKEKLFTLIELLVVIAIIAVLMTLLFPGLKSARDAAKKLSCLSNLKQAAYACQMYVSDYHRYPTTVSRPENTDDAQRIRWWRCLGPYINKNWAPDLLEAQDKAMLAKERILGCPSAVQPPDETTYSVPKRNGPYLTHYGMSYWYDQGGSAPHNWPYYTIPAAKVRNAATFLFGDRRLIKGVSDWPWIPQIHRTSSLNYPDSRHGGMANFSFVDCHAASMKSIDYSNSKYWDFR